MSSATETWEYNRTGRGERPSFPTAKSSQSGDWRFIMFKANETIHRRCPGVAYCS